MTTDAPGDMIRMQNPNQAKRCPPEMAGAAIFMYYEATYDGDKKELRLDAYRKIQSVSIPC